MEKNLETIVKVDGSIVSELSERIPSNIVALNELIKNSYDAGSPEVEIVIDSKLNILKIADKGEGMSKNDIDTLFHISKSTKKFGQFNDKYKRYVQGSKGLGFLSVFKFGHKVEWKTKKDLGYRFFLCPVLQKRTAALGSDIISEKMFYMNISFYFYVTFSAFTLINLTFQCFTTFYNHAFSLIRIFFAKN